MSNKLDLIVEQGTDFSHALALTNPAGTAIDITGDTFAGQIRTAYSAAAATESFAFTVLSAVGGTLVMSLTDTETSALAAPYIYVYDVEWTTAAGKVIRLLYGRLKLIVPEVTK